MSNYGRYFSPRDFNLVHSFNSELFSDLIQSLCTIYKLSPEETTTNIYGEATSEKGKVYYPGKTIECLVEFSPSTTDYSEFGPDKKKLVNFRFVERFMQQSNIYPETGDIVFWDNQFFEVSNNIQEQYIGGQEGKQLSIICETFLVRLSGLNIVEDESSTNKENGTV